MAAFVSAFIIRQGGCVFKNICLLRRISVWGEVTVLNHPYKFSAPGALDYDTLSQSIESLCDAFPFVRKDRVGRSLLGKEIPALFVGETRTAMLIAAAFHGMEWITGWIALEFLRYLCVKAQEGNPQASDFFLHQGLCIVPCVNPDGVEIQIHGAGAAEQFEKLVERVSGGDTQHWQANARGVDLNHNFDAGWRRLRHMEQKSGITGPAATRFGGRFPESEPETAALASFCRRKRFSRAIALHTQGWEIYYRYGRHTPEESYEIARRMAEAGDCLLADAQGLASLGGFKDWFIDYFHKPAFTAELGYGKNPLPLYDAPGIFRRCLPLLLEFLA